MSVQRQILFRLVRPHRDLTRKGRRFQWNPACESAYQEICRAMTSDAALKPFDPTLPMKHVADAAPDGIASSLFQVLPDGVWVPVDHASRALTPVEQNYSQFERESLAQAWGITYHRHHLLGINFESYTDHRPLLTVYNNGRRGNARVGRHRLKVQEYTFTMRHLPGREPLRLHVTSPEGAQRPQPRRAAGHGSGDGRRRVHQRHHHQRPTRCSGPGNDPAGHKRRQNQPKTDQMHRTRTARQ